jgi:hypothetical protein
MYCPECGVQLENNPKFCPNCGHSITGNVAPAPQVTVNPPPDTPVPAAVVSPSLGTKWLKFYTYFSLPVGGVLELLQSLDSPLVVIVFPISILQFVLAYGLHHRRLWAWQWNWVVIALHSLGYLGFIAETAEKLSAAYSHVAYQEWQILNIVVLVGLILGLIWVWANYVYWKKRRILFS